jgi:hypothetical protein
MYTDNIKVFNLRVITDEDKMENKLIRLKSHWGTLVPRINVENGIKYVPTTVLAVP